MTYLWSPLRNWIVNLKTPLEKKPVFYHMSQSSSYEGYPDKHFSHFSIKKYVVGASNEYPQHIFKWRKNNKYQDLLVEKCTGSGALVEFKTAGHLVHLHRLTCLRQHSQWRLDPDQFDSDQVDPHQVAFTLWTKLCSHCSNINLICINLIWISLFWIKLAHCVNATWCGSSWSASN